MDATRSGIGRHIRTCGYCEANCGVVVTADHDQRRIIRVEGDPDDPFSKGFVCPKSYAWTEAYSDPDRLWRPLRKRGRDFEEISWDEALDYTVEGFRKVQRLHGDQATAIYVGNPTAHDVGFTLYGLFGPTLAMELQAAGKIYTAGGVDQLSKVLSTGLLFGDQAVIPVPDIDRTKLFIIIGANPMVSNGSLMTAPGTPRRLKAMRERGARIVVIDPRRTETADIADQHIAIKPGTDAYLLFSLVYVLFKEGLTRHTVLEKWLRPADLETLQRLAVQFPPERVAQITGVGADIITALARQSVSIEPAVFYGRLGTSAQPFGTLTSWLVDVLNILTGNLDREGGAMFPLSPVPALLFNDRYGPDGAPPYARFRTRVRGLPEVAYTLPNGTLAEEIETPGVGQIRALFSMAGNPVLSGPNGGRLGAALDSLDFYAALDIQVNETTRHADVILPSVDHAECSDFPLFFSSYMVRSFAKWTAPIFDRRAHGRDSWEIVLELIARFQGIGLAQAEENMVRGYLQKYLAAGANTAGRDVDFEDALAKLGSEPGPDRIYDILLRTGPFGDAFGEVDNGLTLAKLKQHKHGLDLGPMQSRIAEILATPDRKIHLAHPVFTDDVKRLERAASKLADPENFLLFGRRHLRSNNSWMHNYHLLAKGPNRCTAMLNPKDAEKLGIAEGKALRVKANGRSIDLPAELSDRILPGTVSIPHGWGHDLPGTRMQIAARNPGANVNSLIGEDDFDVPSGIVSLNGILVQLEAVASTDDERQEALR
ncbi:MAG: molybdopterin-dependent oxidoreductase [Sphingomonadaceae bacterium]|nr:molybdopterin-dependent oxidoreductase [Sphingomonadaceae bacterium]